MLPKLRGIVKKYPISGVGFGVAALAIAGVPPMNTFFSKFQIIAGGFSVGAGNVAILVLVCIMVAETVATFAWFLKWMGYCLPGEPSASPRDGVRVHRAHHHGHRQRPAFGQLDRLGGRTTWDIRSSTSLAAF